MLYKLINVPGTLDILVLSFSSDIVYYFSVLSFSPTPSLLPLCILEHSHLLSPDAGVLFIQPRSKTCIQYFLKRSYYVSGTVLGARNSVGNNNNKKAPASGNLYCSKNKCFYLIHLILFPSLTPILSHPGPGFHLLTSPFCSAKPLSLLCSQNELFKTQFYLAPSSP